MKTTDFKPMAWVLPQPVLIIGTYDENGTPNAMNAAWGGQWDFNEVMISLGNHQTTKNLNRTGEFTLAFATKETLEAADYVGIVSGKTIPDKIAKAGWKASKGEHVNAPVFDAFPMTMECRVTEKIGDNGTGYNLIGRIVNIVCKDEYLADDGKPDVEKMKLITFDPIHNNYIQLGESVGKAFSAGNKLK